MLNTIANETDYTNPLSTDGSFGNNLIIGNRVVSPIKGEVCTQYIRCGKRECRCVRGELHGPYFYHVWREGDKVRKVYVKSENVAYVQACCDAYREFSRALTDVRTTRRAISRSIMKSWRSTKPLIQTHH